MELTQLEGRGSWDYSYQFWDEFSLDNLVTSWVKITVIRVVYTSYNNAFIEMEFYVGTSKQFVCK